MAARLRKKKKLLVLTTHPFILLFYLWDVIICTKLVNLPCKISFAENFLERLSKSGTPGHLCLTEELENKCINVIHSKAVD